MELQFQGLGWKTTLRQKRYTYFITLDKALVVGNGLKAGESLYSYLIQLSKRNALLIFLDGQERGAQNTP